jgi:demethylmenaquinone methyltransferase / 2-methoxy-6-polyprenyl-1,4-benzoquinol methylase
MDKLRPEKQDSYRLFDQVAPTYDLLNRLLSFGIDSSWRHELLSYIPYGNDLSALDLATGTADVALTLATAPQIGHITGLDLSSEMLDRGRKKIEKQNLSHKICLELGDGVNIPAEDNSFDLITIAFGIRNFADPWKAIREMHRVLRTGGRVLILEFSLPKSRAVKTVYLSYFRHILPTIGRILSGHGRAYKYLNQTVEEFPYGQKFADRLSYAGFKNVTFEELTLGIASIYSGDKIIL